MIVDREARRHTDRETNRHASTFYLLTYLLTRSSQYSASLPGRGVKVCCDRPISRYLKTQVTVYFPLLGASSYSTGRGLAGSTIHEHGLSRKKIKQR